MYFTEYVANLLLILNKKLSDTVFYRKDLFKILKKCNFEPSFHDNK